MNVTDDVTITEPGPGRSRGAAWAAFAALLGGALLGALAAWVLLPRWDPGHQARYETEVSWSGGPPGDAEWPRAPRPGESARRAGDDRLVVRSFTAAGTESLARALERRRMSGVDAAARRRAAMRAEWRDALAAARADSARPVTGEPLWDLPRAAALVRGRLLLVALANPGVAPREPASTPAGAGADATLARTRAEVLRLARAAQADSLAAALVADAKAENAWLRVVASGAAGGSLAALEAAWRWHEREGATALDSTERGLEARLGKGQNEAVVAEAFARALELERLAPDPAAVLFAEGAWAPATARPVRGVWAAWLAAGAALGALLAGALLLQVRPRRAPAAAPRPSWAHADERAQLGRDPRSAWESDLAWLHLVSGPDRGRIAHAATMLASGFLGRHERVLLVDAGRRLALHERFAADTRWGLGECLAGEVPLLGAVQSAGRPGFFLLAHGASARAERWDELSRVLEEAQAHFGRVILAIDAHAPRAAALPLGGRVLEAWWAEPGQDLPRAAQALAERLAVRFTGLDLNWLVQDAPAPAALPAPEAAGAAETAAQAGSPALAGPDAADDLARISTEADAVAASAAMERPEEVAPAEPIVLPCDPAVRERLRFLVWMRRVRSERLPATLGSGASR